MFALIFLYLAVGLLDSRVCLAFVCTAKLFSKLLSPMRIPVASSPCQHLALSVFSTLAILAGVWFCLTVIYCISLMTKSVKPLGNSLS